MHIHLLIARLLCWWITASQVTWWRPFWSRQKIQVRRWPNVDSKGLELGIPKRGVPFLSAKNWPSYCLTSHASFWNWCLALAISLYGQCGTWTQSSSSLRCLRQCLTRFPCTLSPMAADHFDIHIFFRSQLDTVASIQFQTCVQIFTNFQMGALIVKNIWNIMKAFYPWFLSNM